MIVLYTTYYKDLIHASSKNVKRIRNDLNELFKRSIAETLNCKVSNIKNGILITPLTIKIEICDLKTCFENSLQKLNFPSESEDSVMLFSKLKFDILFEIEN